MRAARQADAIPDTLLLLEHPPVYTRGRRSAANELPLGEGWYRERGIDIVDVDRGGKLTYHGPGQLVGYPIMRIVDVIAYLRTIEQAIVRGARGRRRHRRPRATRRRRRTTRASGPRSARSRRSASTSRAA